KQKLVAVYLSNMSITIYLMLFINGVFFFKSEEIISILLGEKWLESAVYLKIISLGSLFFPIISQVQNLLKVLKRVRIFFQIDFVNKIVCTTLVILLANFLSFPNVLALVLAINAVFSLVYLYV